eukprot:COSAG04_NODE_10760_length_755_cov_1.009146_1_plen_127_part_10
MGDSPPGAWTVDEDQYTRSEQRKIDKATRRQQKTMEQGFDTANPLADAALNELAVRGTALFHLLACCCTLALVSLSLPVVACCCCTLRFSLAFVWSEGCVGCWGCRAWISRSPTPTPTDTSGRPTR